MKKRNFIQSLCCFFLVFITTNVIAQEIVYSEVSVNTKDNNAIQRLVDLGFDIDHYKGNGEESISFFVTQEELEKLNVSGFSFEVIIPDYKQYYAQQQQMDTVKLEHISRSSEVANGFDFGSMGGFYTYAEVEAKLDEMKQDFPNLITTKASIGTSIEGRAIWMVKISDNPDVSEPEPAAYFDALHHAREPLSMAVTINYMFWLLENYDTDTSVKYLVDNRELYFVPVVNPDGYEYNRQTNPNGGGLWRKNRKVNSGGCFGVDLNRNYGFEFANSNSCSSPDPCSNIYRGDAAFSEPETSAVRDFLNVITPNTGFSTHSTAGTYLMPYGYNTSPPDFEIYSEWASSFLNENDYTYGVTFQMLGYTSCGTTRDYLHSEGIYGWTPEIDGSGFWPPQSTIFDLVSENIRPLMYQSWIAGAYLDVQSHTQLGDAMPGESFELVVEVKNVGVGATAENVSVVLSTSVPEVTTPTATTYNSIPVRTKKDNAASPFLITIDPSFTGDSFMLKISTIQDGAPNEELEIPIYVGSKTSLFFDDAESGDTNWVASGNGISWGTVADDAYSRSNCFGDSNGGNGQNNTTNFFELTEVFDLTATVAPQVSFMSKRSIEFGDRVEFQISTDGGTAWDNIETYRFNDSWNSQKHDLLPYIGFADVRFRFRMQTDGFIPGDGFYFDDFEVADYEVPTLGTPTFENASTIQIHPNPFLNKITIEFMDADLIRGTKVQLYNLRGRLLETQLMQETTSLTINSLEVLASGIYFLKVSNDSGNDFVKKIIKR